MQSSGFLSSATVSPETDNLRRDTQAELDRLWNAVSGSGLTDAEAAAGIVKFDPAYAPGDIRRYGALVDGATDDSVAWQQAIDQNLQGGSPVVWIGNSALASQLSLGSNLMIAGAGIQRSTITYTGSGIAFRNTTGGRILYVVMRDFYLVDTGTGTKGIDLEDVSLGYFSNLNVNGFGTDIELDSTTAGYCVYNRFINVTCFNGTIGVDIQGPSSNANVFLGCRFNACTTGWQVADSNGCVLEASQFDGGTTCVNLTASGAGLTIRNQITNNRFESATNNIVLGTNVAHTWMSGNYHVNGTGVTDSGTLNQNLDVYATASVLVSNTADTTLGAPSFTIQRTSNSSTYPCLKVYDSATASGTPTTLNVDTGRSTGKFISGTRGGNEYFTAYADGSMAIRDGITGPAAVTGMAVIYVDTADGDLKVRFSDGFIAVIAADS